MQTQPELPDGGAPAIELRVTTTNVSAWGRILSIEFPRRHYEFERGRALRELRRRLIRPGFRRGHVPSEFIEREYGERLRSDTLEKLIPEVCHRAIEQEGLDVISTPSVKSLDLDHPELVRMDVELDVRPRLQLRDLGSLRVEKWLSEPRDEEVELALAALRERHAHLEAVQRPARDGDYVQVSYVPLDEAGRERTGKRVENYRFVLGGGQVVDEFESAVRGLEPEQTARAEVQYPADHTSPDLAGKQVAFVLTLKEVKEKHVPELDDDLARDLGLEDLQALRQRVRADLTRELAQESERELREKLVDALIAANPFEVPRSLVERYWEAVVAEYDERHLRLQTPVDPEKREQFRNAARPAAERAARRMLLLEQLRREYGLEAAEEDVDRWIEHRVQAGGPEAERLRGFFAKPEPRRKLRGELTEDVVFEFVKGKAQIVEIPRPAAPSGLAG